MNSLRLFAVITLSLALAASPTRADEKQDRERLRQVVEAYEQAVNARDLSKLEPLVAPKFGAVMVSGETAANLDDVQKYWTGLEQMIGQTGKYSVKIVPEKSEVFGDFAIERGVAEEQLVTSNGRTFQYTSQWSATLQRSDDTWKLVQVQSTLNPMTNAFTQTFVTRVLWIAGASGLMVGLVLGGTVVGLLTRRREAIAEPRQQR